MTSMIPRSGWKAWNGIIETESDEVPRGRRGAWQTRELSDTSLQKKKSANAEPTVSVSRHTHSHTDHCFPHFIPYIRLGGGNDFTVSRALHRQSGQCALDTDGHTDRTHKHAATNLSARPYGTRRAQPFGDLCRIMHKALRTSYAHRRPRRILIEPFASA